MCLGEPYKNQQARIRKLTTHGYIRIYKITEKSDKGFYPPIWGCIRYKQNVSHAELDYLFPVGNSGWHGFTDIKSALIYYNTFYQYNRVILTCLALPEWVIECGRTNNGLKTIRLRTLFFPKYPETRAKIKDFRKAIKS